jgi:hypothetical protein
MHDKESEKLEMERVGAVAGKFSVGDFSNSCAYSLGVIAQPLMVDATAKTAHIVFARFIFLPCVYCVMVLAT